MDVRLGDMLTKFKYINFKHNYMFVFSNKQSNCMLMMMMKLYLKIRKKMMAIGIVQL
jgi:hypothetical protein